MIKFDRMKTRFFQISSFCKTGSGTTPSRNKQDLYYGGSIPWVKSGELRESVIAQTEETVTEQALAETPLKIAPKGSILIAMYGANVGRVGILGVEATTNQAVCHIVPDQDKADSRYLFHILRQKLPEFISKSVGGAQPNISQQIIRRTEIPLPPIAEQKRIAAILDKAEELRGLRRKALGELDAIVQSNFLEMFGDPETNPKGWEKGSLGDIATFVGGGTPKRERPEYFEGSICWATSKDMKSEFLDDTQEHITPQAIEESATNLVPIGTILIVVKSKILAHSLPVAITRIPTCFGQDIKGIKISERCTVPFVATALRYGKRWLLERARGINTEGLTLDHLKSFPLILPPLPLQQEFARQVEAIEQLKTTHRKSLAQLDTLFASLQHHAFQSTL
ncbi:restriction endonuclease subunit S [Leptolyngbya sp. GGD]|uniref:restriction endonuclease subunit S n=1 Tax=Leptolyngbya sp. GGD TaxID=2997907 RepID=UPI00227A2A43|nr:restriction endonuclease subunit S [Leptolyngbya sp. GGD]MCY6494579.1 restriction endonuclease subunit S [Leptolyngbya sp. GGD]